MAKNPYNRELLEFMDQQGKRLLRYDIADQEAMFERIEKLLHADLDEGKLSKSLERLVLRHMPNRDDVVRLLNNRRSWRRNLTGTRAKTIYVSKQNKERIDTLVNVLNYDSEDELITELLNAMATDPKARADAEKSKDSIVVPIHLKASMDEKALVDELIKQLPAPFADLLDETN
ncbi:hypothetical protein K0504_18065 [Neiella marina]|uniref:Uncharacterized protein n=1 Tax=Neiella holothuriorum TaxID=2870530 RepID=A0ABS7EMX9_9GAMM|nr:hypothetical protein [Neiella holothuriorum]MBW8192941.1 hypothetical protein [Neiella holothuriorum]